MNPTIFIAGAGGIGRAAGLLLTTSKEFPCKVILGDIDKTNLINAKTYIMDGGCDHEMVSTVLMSDKGEDETLKSALAHCHIILDCLPGSLAPKIASLAIRFNCHYANLTEYVAETNQIMEMAKNANKGFVLQTGLAPGFINVLACKLRKSFIEQNGSNQLESMNMKVGALSQHAFAPHYYAFTWSPIGVATEYIKDAEITKNHKKIAVPALSGKETMVIDGVTYEDNYTSGGAADLPIAFADSIKSIAYKTLRYPGHYDWIHSILNNIPEGEDKIRFLETTMLNNIPMVEDDKVIIYASVAGYDERGYLQQLEASYDVRPMTIGKVTLKAIQSTTAAPLCEMARYMWENDAAGVITQSTIDPDKFLDGDFVRKVYGAYAKYGQNKKSNKFQASST